MRGAAEDGNRTHHNLLTEKVLRGCVYGSIRPQLDIPGFVDLYMAGRLKLDEPVTRTYPRTGLTRLRGNEGGRGSP